MKQKESKSVILGWLYGLALWPHPWPWLCSLKVKVWNSLIWGMGVGGLTDMERKGCESIIHYHDCDLWVTRVWLYRILTGVTSDVGVPSTYLVYFQYCVITQWIMILFVITLKHSTHDFSLHQNGRLSFPLWLCLSEYGNIINIFKLDSNNHVVKFDFQLEVNIYICIYVRGNHSHEIWGPSHCGNFNQFQNQSNYHYSDQTRLM